MSWSGSSPLNARSIKVILKREFGGEPLTPDPSPSRERGAPYQGKRLNACSRPGLPTSLFLNPQNVVSSIPQV